MRLPSCIEGTKPQISKKFPKIKMCDEFAIKPILIRKQPKFPTRERHMAIRRKKSTMLHNGNDQQNNNNNIKQQCNQNKINENNTVTRKTCQSCKCPREAHAIYQQQTTTVHERLGFKVVSPAESGVEPRDLGYTWVPPGIRASSRINRYFEQLPVDKVPKIGTEGARYREQQIAYQLPKQDLSLQHCKHLEEQHEASFEDFVTARNEIALDIGYIKDAPYDEHCSHCEGEINTGEMVVAAPKFVENVMWHPRCFTCSTCNELLVDLTYCVHEDKIYCERHYAEMLKPRCAGCDEIRHSVTPKMGDSLLPELGDLVFSVLIGYAGALEFLYVIRHLYHWSCNHMTAATENDAESLKRLQDRMRNDLAAAEAKEQQTGMPTMKDGVLYKDGFRIDPEQVELERLKAEQSTPEAREKRKKEIEAELKRQHEIEEQTRQQLAEAEAQLAQQRKQAAEEAEEARKLLEAERAREAEQRRQEEERQAEEEQSRKLLERERQREEEERKRAAEAEAAAERRKEEEELRRRREEEEEQKVAEEAAARKRAEEEEARKAAEEAAARKRAEEEEAQKASEEAVARKQAEESQKAAEEAVARKRAEEEEARRQREAELLKAVEEKAAKEAEEQSLKLLEVERKREEEQRKHEIEEEEQEANKSNKQNELQLNEYEEEDHDNERKLLETERLREAEERNHEIREEEAEEEEPEEEELQRVNVNEAHASGKLPEMSEEGTLNSILQLLNAESERRLNEIEYEENAAREREERQKLIEENARKFLEADHEMEELLESVQKQRQYSGTESAPQSPVYEEPCLRKTMSPHFDTTTNSGGSSERSTKTVKTQFGQKANELYSVSTKPLLFRSISDDTPSFEPQSSLSPQHSEEYAASGVDGGDGPLQNKIDVQFAQLERQEPDGEDQDNTTASAQYTEDYLRSLDGIKQRPLVREDGSGRRRAFKKRRSSGSSNSSFDSRASREEELKMFTSLEEEELQPKKQGEIDDYTPIKYTSEPLLKVKVPRRRHKRSPAKDAKSNDSHLRGSLEMLDEESNINPWGEVTPEHYKDMPFWKREKSMSIDEEAIEVELPTVKKEEGKDVNARIIPKASTFEEATHTQNEEAMTTLQRQQTKEEQETNQQEPVSADEPTRSDMQPNLQTTHNMTPNSPTDRKSSSPRLRRSPRIDEMDQYEELWNKTNESENASVQDAITPTTPSTPTTPATPSIRVEQTPDVAPWRDQYGLLMEGISDFYDFTASVNPSRSCSTSRQPSPANSQPSTPAPKNIEFSPIQERETIDIYDDTGSIMEAELTKENVVEFIEALRGDYDKLSQTFSGKLQNVADSPEVGVEGAEGDASRVEMNLLVQTLRVERQSRSRSRSPLPTADQLERSVNTRRHKLIEKNDKLFETLNSPTADKEFTIESPTIIIESSTTNLTDKASERDSMRLLVGEQRTFSRSRSQSPLPTPDNLQRSLETRRSRRIKQNDELSEKLGVDINESRTPSLIELMGGDKSPEIHINADEVWTEESMHLLVEPVRVDKANSRSRSHSPLPTVDNIKTGLEKRRKKKIQQNDTLFQQLHIDISSVIGDATTSEETKSKTAPTISIQCCDEEPAELETGRRQKESEEKEYSVENMTRLVESLRLQRSRSKSPMRRLERERTPEPSNMRVGLGVAEHVSESEDEHERRSRTPSRSLSLSPTRVRTHDSSPQSCEDNDFHKLLNLEASQNRTLSKCSEEMESILAEKQRQVDADALHKLSNASEEIELRTVTPVKAYESADKNRLTSMSHDERLRQLRCSPTTPNYERTISQEWNDVQRIKDEMLTSGFKRSTYVGESQDLGSEFVPLREQTARFRRSHSPSPSLVATESRKAACEQREIQEKILEELVTASTEAAGAERLGAKPKEVRSMVKDMQDMQYEELRRLNAEFHRSRSQSRSPLGNVEAQEVAKIEEEAAKRELEDRMKPNLNFQEFSRYLNTGFLDNERRASDSALIQKPEVFMQLQDIEEDLDMEPENYHHFRRFSLNQEQSIEEYPNDDYVFVSQIEVQTPNGTRTWIREDYYSDDFEQLSLISEESGGLTIEAVNEAAEAHLRAAEEEDTDGSEDERQTVVEVEDEIDEDICDFNERGPADESQHEISECEEAERDMDRYADREANDWQNVENIDELLLADELVLAAAAEEGAVGGDAANMLDYDSDSAEIDKIYDEAIRNRKPSGILRDYDSILKEMQTNYMTNVTVTTDGSEADMSGASDSDRNKKVGRKQESEPTLKLIRNERRGEQELRYLGNANLSATQSARLRTRYGYAPQLHGSGVEDLDIEVDLNYKPKREYNWRKNFKIDDEENVESKQQIQVLETQLNAVGESEYLDLRKFSLGGESITLFSQGAEGVCYVASDESQLSADVVVKEEKECNANGVAEMHGLTAVEQAELTEKPKKKKSKKKLRKETRTNSTEYNATKDEDDSESQLYSRRSNSIQMECDSPKRSTKSRSRRNSRNSLGNDEINNLGTFSPRNSVGVLESTTTNNLTNEISPGGSKKKLKKRKKTKEADIKEEPTPYSDLSVNVPTASAAVSPGTASINPLATLSPQNSICTPTSSLDSETPDLKELISGPSSAGGSPIQQTQDGADVGARISAIADALVSSTVATAATSTSVVATRSATTSRTTTKTTVDTFDILKDANFYPLF